MATNSTRRTRTQRLRRELVFWRVIGLGAIALLCFGFAQSGGQREMRFASADGRQSVVISASGISLLDKGKTLGHIGFETVGDGDDQEVDVKVGGLVSGSVLEAQNSKDRLLLKPERIGFLRNGTIGASLTPDGLALQNRSGQTRISLFTPEQGTGGLDFVEHGNVILSLGSFQHFRLENPPRLNAGAISVADFGKPFKSRLITADDSEAPTPR